MPRIITLTTDFGTRDPFVGEVRGVLARSAPGATVIDLTHEVPARDIAAGAFLLETGTRSFPAGTLHLAVVDPGVGTARRAIAVQTDRFRYVAPDNGLLARALSHERVVDARVLTSPGRSARVAPTFHARDVFAPAAARWSAGLPLEELGPPAGVLDLSGEIDRAPLPIGADARRPVRVLWVDRFGNAALDLLAEQLPDPAVGRAAFHTATGARIELRTTYGDVGIGDPLAVVNGAGYVEIAVREGRADTLLGLAIGDRVEVGVEGVPSS